MTKMNDPKVIEPLAEYAHKAWSGWMRYMFSKATDNLDGTVTIPESLVSRWKRQMNTDYADLPETEKVSDRTEAEMIVKTLDNIKRMAAEEFIKAVEGIDPSYLKVVRMGDEWIVGKDGYSLFTKG